MAVKMHLFEIWTRTPVLSSALTNKPGLYCNAGAGKLIKELGPTNRASIKRITFLTYVDLFSYLRRPFLPECLQPMGALPSQPTFKGQKSKLQAGRIGVSLP
jgi:hypothetical protein